MSDVPANNPPPTFQTRDFLGYELEGSHDRTFDFAEVAKTTQRLLAENWLSVLLITFVLDFTPQVILPLMTEAGFFDFDWDNWEFLANITTNDDATIWPWIITTLLTFLASGYVTLLLVSRELRQPTSVAHYITATIPILTLSVLVTVACLVGIVLLVVPGVLLYLTWSVALPVLLGEKQGVIKSLGRSGDLTSGSQWQIFWLTIGYGVFSVVTGFTGVFLGDLVFDITSIAEIQTVLPTTMTAITDAVFTIAFVALYLHLRFLKEGPQKGQVASIFE